MFCGMGFHDDGIGYWSYCGTCLLIWPTTLWLYREKIDNE
jgi:hypothetical protein